MIPYDVKFASTADKTPGKSLGFDFLQPAEIF